MYEYIRILTIHAAEINAIFLRQFVSILVVVVLEIRFRRCHAHCTIATAPSQLHFKRHTTTSVNAASVTVVIVVDVIIDSIICLNRRCGVRWIRNLNFTIVTAEKTHTKGTCKHSLSD